MTYTPIFIVSSIPLRILPLFIFSLFAFSTLFGEEDEELFAEIDALLDLDADVLETSVEKAQSYLFSELAAGLGYTDNVFLESSPIGATFGRLSAEVFSVHETPRFGSVQAFLIYDQSFYDDIELNGENTEVPDETNAYGDLRWSYLFSGYEVNLGAAYSYAEYFFEPISGSDFSGSDFLTEKRPIYSIGIGKELSQKLTTELRLSYEMPRFDGTAEDFDKLRIEIITDWKKLGSHALRIRFAYALDNLIDGAERGSSGISLPNTTLEVNRFLAEVRWDYKWSSRLDGEWRLPFRIEIRDDSGGGYYDRWQLGLSPQLSWSWAKFEFEIRAALDYVEYMSRTVSFVDDASRWQWRSKAQLELSRKLGPGRVWTKAEWTDLDSNASTNVYESKSYEMGFSVEF